jgi:hypothetical protein
VRQDQQILYNREYRKRPGYKRSIGNTHRVCQCGKTFLVYKSGDKRGKGKFCSKECSGKFKPKPTARKWLIKEEKQCIHCGATKPLSQFTKNRSCHHHRENTCRSCTNIQIRPKRERDVEQLRDPYIRGIFARHGLPDPPKELIELKRVHIKLKRQLKQLHQ